MPYEKIWFNYAATTYLFRRLRKYEHKVIVGPAQRANQ